MIITVLTASLTLLLGTVCSVFAQSDDIGSVLDKAQKSLSQNAKDTNYSSTATNADNSNYKTYENVTHGVTLKYPKDWLVTYQPTDYYEYFPETTFNVKLVSPEVDYREGVMVSIYIEKLQPSTTTLTEYKNRLAVTLRNDYPDTKEVAVFTDTLAGEPAYRIENMIWKLDHWEKNIDLGFIKEGKLYEIRVLAKPDSIQKHSSEIKNMIQSVEFKHPVAVQQNIDTKNTKIKSSDLTQIESTHKISKKPTRQSNCDSSYPDFCIPPPPPNLNCPDISQKRFTVTGSDVHGFDRDNDGIGCES
jgi:hypothetical protein